MTSYRSSMTSPGLNIPIESSGFFVLESFQQLGVELPTLDSSIEHFNPEPHDPRSWRPSARGSTAGRLSWSGIESCSSVITT